MRIASFFSDTLGAKLKNVRWSWGATDSLGRIFLRIWKHDIEEDRYRVAIGGDKPRRNSRGFSERRKHIASFQSGAECFGVKCIAENQHTPDVRKIVNFDNAQLLRLCAPFQEEDGVTYAHIVGIVSVHDVVRERRTLEDLTEIERRRDIPPTTKAVLTLARVGQGRFRTALLRCWGGRCAVTGASTQEAIRASHIKSWRDSTDKERLDPDNGIPLVANLDALFDAGLISFDSSGRMLVAAALTPAERRQFGLDTASLRQAPPAKMAAYLASHRKAHGFQS